MLILDNERWDELERVNSRVNELPGVVDLARWGVPEFWIEIDQLGGDCEDFALRKRRELLDLGWPVSALRLAECETETGERHAVLTIDAECGTYVLDNRFPDVEPWRSTPMRGYRWIRRQAAGGRGWVAIRE